MKKMIGEYALLQRLGKGGMGQIWRARREVLGGASTHVAIKLMSNDIGPDIDVRKHFIKEARLSLLLRSSNIVRVFDVAQTREGMAYIVMEWIDGLNLAQLCKKMWEKGETLSEGAIAFILAEIAKGIMHAHELRSNGSNLTVIHRDISPHNIMLSRHGEVKLLDFGIARVATEDTSATLAGAGKIRYMPPEQFRGKTRHPTLDLFPLGAILHELLDQRRFRFVAVDQMQLYGLSLAGIVPPLSPDTHAPPKLAELRERLLRYEPRERPQSARELFEELIAWEGYSNATLEIEDMVRRHLGPSIDPSTTGSYAPTPIEPATTVPEGKRKSSVEAHEPPVRIPKSVTAALVEPTVSSRSLATRRKRTAVGIACAGLLAVLGLGSYFSIPLSAGVSQGLEDAPRASSEDTALPTPQPPSQGAQLERKTQPAPPQALPLELEPEPKPKPKPESEPEPEAKAKAKAKAAPISEPGPVTAPAKATITSTKLSLRLVGVPWAQVKIGKHIFTLDMGTRSKTKTIPARSYETKYRTTFDGKWKSGPKLELDKRRLEYEISAAGLAPR